MTALTTQQKFHPQLPAFLQNDAAFAASDQAVAGIGGSQPPYISIRGSKWALVDAAGDTLYVQQIALDVIVLTGNPHVSKVFYAGAYDPASGNASPPTCFSDNGLAPSINASTPQHATCAGCPNAAWGSKITPTGSQVKACSDSKKLAVVLASDTPYVTASGASGVAPRLQQVYLLRVPAASMSVWRDYAKEIVGRGIPLIGVITRLSFNPQSAYPALLFNAVGLIQVEADYRACEAKLGGSDIRTAIGSDDRPGAGAAPVVALPAPAAPVALPAPVAAAPMPAPAPMAAMPGAATVLAAAPAIAAAPRPTAPRAARQPRAPAPAMQMPAAAPLMAAPAPMPPAAAPMAPMPGAAPAQVIQQPTASDASLDALLAQHLGVPAQPAA